MDTTCTCEPTGPEPWDHAFDCPMTASPQPGRVEAVLARLEPLTESTYAVIHEGTVVETIVARGADAAQARQSQPGHLYVKVGES